jgi:hypothetical protein
VRENGAAEVALTEAHTFYNIQRENEWNVTVGFIRVEDITTLQRTSTENWKQIFPEKELLDHSPNFHIHVSVIDLNIPTMDLPILLQEICGPILGIYKSLTDT